MNSGPNNPNPPQRMGSSDSGAMNNPGASSDPMNPSNGSNSQGQGSQTSPY